MSRTGSAADVRPGARRARPRRRLASWLVVLVAVPAVLGLAFAGLRVTGSLRDARGYGQSSRLAGLNEQVLALGQALADERVLTAAFAASGRPAASRPALDRQYAVTNARAAAVRRLALQLDPAAPAAVRTAATTALSGLAGLPGLRLQAAGGQATPLQLISGYSAVITGLFPLGDSLDGLTGNAPLAAGERVLGALSRVADQAALQQAILGAAFARGHLGLPALSALTTAQAQENTDLTAFRGLATAEENRALAGTLASTPARQAQAVESQVIAASAEPLAAGSPASHAWQSGMSYETGWLGQAQRQLAAWSVSDAQALQRRAEQSALITAGVALACLLILVFALLIAVRSLTRPRRRLAPAALEPARWDPVPPDTDEARLRGLNAVYVTFFRRSHQLLDRLLAQIDTMELDEEDPVRLERLYEVDHLATRMRRSSDSALALAGELTPDSSTEPVALVDVLRAAVSETEQYDRVNVSVQPGFALSGSAVADVVHLLAELLDNALAFSPAQSRVGLSGQADDDGSWQVTITDSGTGLPADQLRRLNWQLADPERADPAAGQVGLFTVAELAARHGLTVTLSRVSHGGTAADVRLPAELISPDGLEIATPGAVPLMVGAPLPSPTLAPEARPAEQTGPLPIFDSVRDARARTDRPAEITPAGLPQRIPPTGPAPQPEPSSESAREAASQLSSFQRGARRARAETEPARPAEPAAPQPAGDR
jgi:signal transduction histidine kinase